ncbi:MAG: glycine cleavage system protein H [Acidobacteria bacterium]|nr:glycine cleavage system protein H [Acidobacteriota bacterium]
MVALFVATLFIGFIMVDLIVQKVEALRAARSAAALAAQNALESWITVPEGVRLSKGHSWSLPLQEGTVRAGADALVAKALGSISRVTLPAVGEWVEAGAPLSRLELAGHTVTITSPVGGRISAVNHELKSRPELVATDPYGKGWVCSIAQVAPQDRAAHFGREAVLWMESEVERLREFLSARLYPGFKLGVTSQDAGPPMPGALAQFDVDAWAAFENEFTQHL